MKKCPFCPCFFETEHDFNRHMEEEINKSLEYLKDVGLIYEPLPGVFRSVPHSKGEWHFLLDVVVE